MMIYLDFDGVLNSVFRKNAYNKAPRVTGFDDFRKEYFEAYGEKFPIWLSDQRNQLIAEITEGHQIVWATTWLTVGDIDLIEAWTGLRGIRPNPEGYGGSITPRGGTHWKAEMVRDIAPPDEPFVWVDDDTFFVINKETKNWNKDRKVPGKLVTPSEYYGLTRDHLTDIQRYVGENS